MSFKQSVRKWGSYQVEKKFVDKEIQYLKKGKYLKSFKSAMKARGAAAAGFAVHVALLPAAVGVGVLCVYNGGFIVVGGALVTVLTLNVRPVLAGAAYGSALAVAGAGLVVITALSIVTRYVGMISPEFTVKVLHLPALDNVDENGVKKEK